MKRVDLVRHLEDHGCRLLREGGSHSVFVQSETRKVSTVPRHREIKELLARKICKVIRRRFAGSLNNFDRLYRPVTLTWRLYERHGKVAEVSAESMIQTRLGHGAFQSADHEPFN